MFFFCDMLFAFFSCFQWAQLEPSVLTWADFNKLRWLKASVILLSLVKTELSDFKCLLLHSRAATFITGAELKFTAATPLEEDAKHKSWVWDGPEGQLLWGETEKKNSRGMSLSAHFWHSSPHFIHSETYYPSTSWAYLQEIFCSPLTEE